MFVNNTTEAFLLLERILFKQDVFIILLIAYRSRSYGDQNPKFWVSLNGPLSTSTIGTKNVLHHFH